MSHGDRDRRRPGERHATAQHSIQNRAHRIQIARDCGRRVALDVGQSAFGREVINRIGQHFGNRKTGGGERLTHAGIGNFEQTVSGTKHLSRTQIAVNDAVFVQQFETVRDLSSTRERFDAAKRRATQTRFERLSGQPFRNEKRRAFFFADFKKLRDVRVLGGVRQFEQFRCARRQNRRELRVF